MYSDRELLALAAKAAGLQLCGYSWIGENEDDDEGEVLESAFVKLHPEQELASKWNPLTDDGDALRLAVKCGIRFGSGAVSSRPRVAWWQCGQMNSFDMPEDDGLRLPQNWTEWTRRAIVLAAAAIGETK